MAKYTDITHNSERNAFDPLLKLNRRVVSFTVLGECASMKNSRRIVTSRATGKPMSIKSAKSMSFFHSAALQIPNLTNPFATPVKVTMTIYYASERPDLDESVLLDAMQSTSIGTGRQRRIIRSGVIVNDRLVRWKDIRHGIDAKNPRAEIVVETLA
jgi:hypothetical protein